MEKPAFGPGQRRWMAACGCLLAWTAACGADPEARRLPSQTRASGSPAQPMAAPGAAADGFGAQPGAAGASAAPNVPGPMEAGPGSAAGCGTVTQMAEIKKGPADIVWIIDGSASMNDEAAAVSQNITNFATSISAAGIDHHVVLLGETNLAASTPLGADASRYQFVQARVNSLNSLQVLIEEYPQYSAFLRPDASLHFVVVTDDDSILAAADFMTQMMQLSAKPFTFHAIASETPAQGLACVGPCGNVTCGAARPGVQYYALADATGGQKISICTADWSKVFGSLQSAVIEGAPLPCDYAIPLPPAGETLDPNRVNFDYVGPMGAPQTFPRTADMGACGTQVAWYYDNPTTPTAIRMCPAACDALSGGGTIQIQLGCETLLVQ